MRGGPGSLLATAEACLMFYVLVLVVWQAGGYYYPGDFGILGFASQTALDRGWVTKRGDEG